MSRQFRVATCKARLHFGGGQIPCRVTLPPLLVLGCRRGLYSQPSGKMKEEIASLASRLNGLRCEGNQFFAEKNYDAAIDLYTTCISECSDAVDGPGLEFDDCEQRNGDDFSGAIRNTLALAFSNRAESYLRVKNFKNALADAERVLDFDPNNVKSLNRRGKALEGLEQFEKAYESFSAAHKQAPRDLYVENSVKRTKICVRQSQKGDYNLSDYYLRGCKGDIDPCCDYVGPVEISKVQNAGRGLIVTQDVAPGELLFVSNALAMAFVLPEPSVLHQGLHFQSGRYEDEHLISKLAEVARRSPKARQQLYTLAYENTQYDMEIPPMDLFRPGAECTLGASQVGSDLDVNLVRIWGVARYSALNLYGHSADISEYVDPLKARRRGLWPLASFVNHSCSPNCIRMHIGSAMFLRAAQHIPAGEELTINYFGVLDSLETRQESARAWGFRCQCRRCQFEEGMAPLEDIGKQFRELIDVTPSWQDDEEYGDKPEVSAADLARVFKAVEDIRNRKHLKVEQKHWVLASCIYAYVSQAATLVNDPERRIPILSTLVDSITLVSAANVWGLEYACDLLKEVDRLHGRSSEEFVRTEKRVMEIFRTAYGAHTSREALEALVQYYTESSSPIHSCDRC